MADWDADGKCTWKDDYIYHEILNTKKSGNPNQSKNNSSGSWKTIVIFMTIVLCWELLNAIAETIY